MTQRNEDRTSWAVGGGLFLGLGVGFFFLRESVLAFLGSVFAGLGLGMMVTSILSNVTKRDP